MMPDDSTLRALFLSGLFVVVSLLVGLYLKGDSDPLVSQLPSPIWLLLMNTRVLS
jgi:hypothetical protein